MSPAVIGVCGFCGQEISSSDFDSWSTDGKKEWYISQVCEPCFDEEFQEPEGLDEDSAQHMTVDIGPPF